ncbi:hypothetical protein KAW18_01950 [candidate division WOR-3 bacterium]|nr:hypothetical protein [candidate division WOR-3 bacterium]
MKIMESFIVDDGKKQSKIELIQIQMKYSFPIHYGYAVVRDSSLRDFLSFYFTKFFAKRRFDKKKNGYKSCWLTYSVYDN